MQGLERFRGVVRVYVRGDLRTEMLQGHLGDARSTPCAPTSRFQIASVPKQFTAAAVVLLAERGALSLEDRLPTWVDGCPRGWGAMTVHHLLTHTAGLPHWRDLPDLDLCAAVQVDDLLAHFFAPPLRAAPGQAWYYSSPGYVLLALVAERAAGLNYAALLDETVFAPLGMGSTFAGNAHGRPDVAAGHVGGAPVPSFELDVVGMGAGDVWTTADDLAIWDAALLQGGLFEPASLSLMTSRHATIDPVEAARNGLPVNEVVTGTGYGYGWFVGTFLGHHMYFHPGDNFGFVALNAVVPDLDLAFFALSNEEESGTLVDLLLDSVIAAL